MEIVVLDGFTLNPGDLSWDALRKQGNCKIYDRTAADETLSRIRNAEIVLTNKVIIDRNSMEAAPNMKYIGVLATGYNVVDIAAAKERGITVTNIPAYSTDSVAQMVFSHILAFCNRVELHTASVQNGDWQNGTDFSYTCSLQTEISGKTVGIVGFGQIGQRVAQIARALGMKVLFYNRSVKNIQDENIRQTSLETVFSKSDFVSLNCPLTGDNQQFVNAALLAKMKPSSMLINTGRGGLVNEKDLAEALNTGQIAAAGLDVLSTEPPKADNPLLTAKNCFITPHIAWATIEARTRLMNIAVENINAFLNGKAQNVVS
ncbi:MAG: glycerate dehydrogenase [Bacteroidetes bacterium GWF2_42_66]|nr:MAG: glycerate dehydrogenase [Bacteroidetes bacterium GWA2_42_15]OFY01111.1 MAG: glycerate dehydrogenase [Bacteroidetes bacterium GWE2_42_39]OFY41954.1 MAG: glycerate dehydrogenase [Bacteroidetes bacterium GWF2_42_66]HBL77851.1 glycerate dehydrogenase [Prolixibacteraceae bacterium]HCR91494.1 glycerate dehydrogenase [Prolixibacteraceae bacterium]